MAANGHSLVGLHLIRQAHSTDHALNVSHSHTLNVNLRAYRSWHFLNDSGGQGCATITAMQPLVNISWMCLHKQKKKKRTVCTVNKLYYAHTYCTYIQTKRQTALDLKSTLVHFHINNSKCRNTPVCSKYGHSSLPLTSLSKWNW